MSERNTQETVNQGQPNGYPFCPMQTDRDMLMYVLLSIVTCGIYSIIFMTKMTNDINICATGRDGKHTMHYCLLAFVLCPITCGIYYMVWMHQFSNRVGDEARARGIDTDFGAGTFWLWNVLAASFLVGPMIYMYKLCDVMNKIGESYNKYGR